MRLALPPSQPACCSQSCRSRPPLASPVSGRLADRIDASKVATAGLVAVVAGIACYAALGKDSALWTLSAALALLGVGVGVFTPGQSKNRVCVRRSRGLRRVSCYAEFLRYRCRHDRHDDYGGVDGKRRRPKLWSDPAAFSSAHSSRLRVSPPFGVISLIDRV